MSNGHEIRAKLNLPLDRFTLSVDLKLRRHVTGIFGASGSGKTSLLETVAGLRRSAQGMLRLGDQLWQDSYRGAFMPPERRNIGYVPQDALLFPHRNVRANLLIGQRRARCQGQDVEALQQEVIALLELDALLERNVDTLSGGERQRVALGRALCSGPRLLLMDEPLASLDLGMRRKLLPFLRTIRQSFDIPMLLVSHDPIEVQALCDELVVLQDGQVIAQGEPRVTLMQASRDAAEFAHLVENVLPCRFERHEGEATLVRIGLEGDGPLLTLPRVSGAGASAQMIAVRSRDIIVSNTRPYGLSARNVLPGVVRRVAAAGKKYLVFCAVDRSAVELAVEVTLASLQELDLKPETPVFLIIKATTLELC
ncbi:MAG: molybdenum ABC transporter ATP-binding protein [Pseudomonadota bacterium]